jgi:peptidoglycan/LPS O-acetylase OafA/YrhL
MAINIPCSLLSIAAIATSSKTEVLLSGRAAAFLGRISFPLYLIHLLVLTSLGCWLYIVVPQPYSAVVATMATVGVSILCAALLAPIDAAWLRALNGLVKRLLFASPRDELANQRQASEPVLSRSD